MTSGAGRIPDDPRASIAVDLGAESCRVSLLRWTGGRPHLQLVHRLSNGPQRGEDGHLRWPLDKILTGLDEGVARCAELAPEGIRSIAVDGWAVDYVRLNPAGEALDQPFCYRDERNVRAAAALHRHISPSRLREITGIEIQPLNTLYQLYADRSSGVAQAPWLNLPEYCLHRWGAEPVAEHTNASHTGMLDLFGGNWSREILEAAELDVACAPKVVPPGTLLGRLSGPLAALPALRDTELIAPACHDTASAIAAIGEIGDDWAYISCGTWSLVGTLLHRPLNSPAVREDNFTNLGAIGGATCFHKGLSGMWLLKQCMDHWAECGEPWDLADLLAAAAAEPQPVHLLQVDDASLLGMGNMPARVSALLARSGAPCVRENSEAAPALVSLLLHSLAARYAEVLQRIRIHTGKHLRRIVMVGGGAQNVLLRQLTAERTGLDVVRGPAESSTLGNLAVQLAVLETRAPVTSDAFTGTVREWAQQLSSLEAVARSA
jgi:rhamnulokinase